MNYHKEGLVVKAMKVLRIFYEQISSYNTYWYGDNLLLLNISSTSRNYEIQTEK